ncbi:MAG: GNAT family protein [Coriobacteriia bacterium]|nr:GNAT family protein [Coriobacteriia bacterium]
MTDEDLLPHISNPDYEGSAILRATLTGDLDRVMEIIESAREFIRTQHIDQWLDGYPSEADIVHDIENGWSYVLENADKEIVGTEAVSFDGEPLYDKVYDGAWEYEGPFAVVHRLANDPKLHGQGFSGLLFAGAEALAIARHVRIMRVDTHPGNIPMRRALRKAGYKRIGKIRLEKGVEAGQERIAFEKYIAGGEDEDKPTETAQ